MKPRASAHSLALYCHFNNAPKKKAITLLLKSKAIIRRNHFPVRLNASAMQVPLLLAQHCEAKWLELPTKSYNSPQVWFAKVGSEPTLIEHQVLEQLSISERSRLESIQSQNKRQEYLLSRALMRHALSERFGLKTQTWQFIEKTNSAPIIQNLPGGHWLSLSHSHGVICFTLANQPIGIDIEQSKARTNFIDLAKAFMNDDELELLNSKEHQTTDVFYKIWCAKEAFYKMLPPSDQDDLFLKKINYFDLIESRHCHLTHGKINDCYLALATKEPPRDTIELKAHTFNGSIPILWD
jgi:4'-phosphopantetheinyl transferase